MQTLFGVRHDYPPYENVPAMQLMVATIPRSGSTAFCNDLWNTGVLGAPMEYLNLNWIGRHGRWKAALNDLRAYWTKIQHVRTSPNGVFSYKLFVQNYFTLLKRCPELLPCLAPTHVVYLIRNDIVAQAVSYARAIRSKQWFHNEYRRVDIEYDRTMIDHARTLIINQRTQWERVFSATAAEVLRVSYEDYVANKAEVVERVVRYVCGPTERAGNLGLGNISVQRDLASNEWIERYNREELEC